MEAFLDDSFLVKKKKKQKEVSNLIQHRQNKEYAFSSEVEGLFLPCVFFRKTAFVRHTL